MGDRPLLKQFTDLRLADLQAHPVWIFVHCEDGDEPWYDETDEETLRPWTGSLPVHPSDGTFLVRAGMTLADGSILEGFCTPAFADRMREDSHPHLFGPDGGLIRFWWGASPPDDAFIAGFYRGLARTAGQVFPIRYRADAGYCREGCEGVIEGFYSIPDFKTVRVQS